MEFIGRRKLEALRLYYELSILLEKVLLVKALGLLKCRRSLKQNWKGLILIEKCFSRSSYKSISLIFVWKGRFILYIYSNQANFKVMTFPKVWYLQNEVSFLDTLKCESNLKV